MERAWGWESWKGLPPLLITNPDPQPQELCDVMFLPKNLRALAFNFFSHIDHQGHFLVLDHRDHQ